LYGEPKNEATTVGGRDLPSDVRGTARAAAAAWGLHGRNVGGRGWHRNNDGRWRRDNHEGNRHGRWAWWAAGRGCREWADRFKLP